MIGPYKYLFMLVTQSDDSNMQLPSPAALYERMRQRDQERDEVNAVYETFEMERFKNSPNYEYIKARQEKNKTKSDIRAVRKAQSEIDHIHSELAIGEVRSLRRERVGVASRCTCSTASCAACTTR
jgi:hypothetical protein